MRIWFPEDSSISHKKHLLTKDQISSLTDLTVLWPKIDLWIPSFGGDFNSCSKNHNWLINVISKIISMLIVSYTLGFI